MSFFPREEYVPRRGVAMRVVEPSPSLRTGVPRDAVVEHEAHKFEDKDFALNKGQNDRPAPPSKVKTFGRNDIPWAVGNGNVIAPPKPEPTSYKRHIGHRVPEEQMHKFYHSPHLEREREVQQQIMEHACNFADNFSPQKPERRHKVLPRVLEPTPQGIAKPIFGFKGLGLVTRDRPHGKAHVPESSFDPLGMRHWGPRATGLKRTANSNQTSDDNGVLTYDDGIPFEATQKRSYPTPHRHQFPENFGPDQDMAGFRGLGKADHPPAPRGRKHDAGVMLDHHVGGGSPERQTPSAGPSPVAPQHGYGRRDSGPMPKPQHSNSQYRSASSLGIASPTHNYGGSPGVSMRGGRESAPPGLGNSVRFHPIQH